MSRSYIYLVPFMDEVYGDRVMVALHASNR